MKRLDRIIKQVASVGALALAMAIIGGIIIFFGAPH